MQNISTEPGGQIELSGAPVETLHQTYAEINSHLCQVRRLLLLTSPLMTCSKASAFITHSCFVVVGERNWGGNGDRILRPWFSTQVGS